MAAVVPRKRIPARKTSESKLACTTRNGLAFKDSSFLRRFRLPSCPLGSSSVGPRQPEEAGRASCLARPGLLRSPERHPSACRSVPHTKMDASDPGQCFFRRLTVSLHSALASSSSSPLLLLCSSFCSVHSFRIPVVTSLEWKRTVLGFGVPQVHPRRESIRLAGDFGSRENRADNELPGRANDRCPRCVRP